MVSALGCAKGGHQECLYARTPQCVVSRHAVHRMGWLDLCVLSHTIRLEVCYAHVQPVLEGYQELSEQFQVLRVFCSREVDGCERRQDEATLVQNVPTSPTRSEPARGQRFCPHVQGTSERSELAPQGEGAVEGQ